MARKNYTAEQIIGMLREAEVRLSQSLKELVADGLVRRIDFKSIPPHVEYELTDYGQDLSERMRPMCEWGTEHFDSIAAAHAGHPVADLSVR